MEKDTIKTERSEELESKLTMKLMGDEKMDFVQWYIENVHETYSMTTEASESGLGTRTTVSEEEIEDVRGKTNLTVVSVVIFNKSMLTVTRSKRNRVVNLSLLQEVASKFAFEGERSIFLFVFI